jgi:hypothetical protein
MSLRLVIEYLDGTKDITGIIDNMETFEDFTKSITGPLWSITAPKADIGMMWIPASSIKKIYEYIPGSQEPVKVKRMPKWNSR